MTTEHRRPELAAFLRSRRERITPADVGMPGGLRRRTPGLRREEVAQLAGVGITWYTWLEQGRPINVSLQVLEAIARTLRLDQTALAALPEGYRHLAYMQELIGYKVKRDMPGLTGPEVEKLYAEGREWLAGKAN